MTSRRVTCPFCLFTNEIVVDEAEPLCVNCRIGITRLVATSDGGVTPAQRPQIVEEPFEPRTKRGRKFKRPKKGKRYDVANAVPLVADPSASVFNVGAGRSLASPQVPPVTPPYGVPIVPPVEPVVPPVCDIVLDESMEATVMHVATPRTQTLWVLEFETGEVIPLPSDDVVVGRHPTAQDGATPVTLPDPTRKLSRTHARLRRDATSDTWIITDLGSSNGVATVNSDTGAVEYATPKVDVAATEYLLIGTLRSRLHRVTVTQQGDATHRVAS